jgi:hypothetical protein
VNHLSDEQTDNAVEADGRVIAFYDVRVCLRAVKPRSSAEQEILHTEGALARPVGLTRSRRRCCTGSREALASPPRHQPASLRPEALDLLTLCAAWTRW